MIRAAKWVFAAVAVAAATPAMPQTTGQPVGLAVALTLKAACERNGFSTCAQLASGTAAVLAAQTGMLTWFNVLDWLNIPRPTTLGAFNGGGASGEWCTDFKFELDAAGNLIVPSIPLEGGNPVSPQTLSILTYYPNVAGTGVSHGAHNSKALQQWVLHLENLQRGTDKRDWHGVYGIAAGGSVLTASTAYFKANGTLVNRITGTKGPGFGYSYNSAGNVACPQSFQGAGGDFDFYPRSGGANPPFDQCTMYAPNPSLSQSGYAYPETTTVRFADVSNYLDNMEKAGYCNVNAEVIRRIAQALWERAANTPGYAGPPAKPVESGDVKSGPTPPTVKDLKDAPALPDPTATPSPYPTPTPSPSPSPSPTSSSGVDLGTDPGIGSPSLADPPSNIMDPIFDWLPDLPSITINTSGAQCPTWEIQPFAGPEWHLVMDAHCDLLEQNRAAIGALMLVLFSIGAALIILRA